MAAAVALTPQQAAALAFVRDQLVETGRSPTLRRVAEHVGFKTTSASKCVAQLVAGGHLVRLERSRGKSSTYALPLGAGSYQVTLTAEAEACLRHIAEALRCPPEQVIRSVITDHVRNSKS